MTERLYYADPYCTTFRAHVLETRPSGDHIAVVLDRSAFYPTGGGQPHDTGTLAGHPVAEVLERESDGAVVHLLPDGATLPPGEIEATVDCPRRFDHMQQHTGQHILSQAFVQLFDADTVGFHLSQTYSTLDLNRSTLTADDITSGEVLANQIVFEDRPVSWRFVTAGEAGRLPLRKPPAVLDNIRIVQVEGFDWSACGGTHVARTGAVGLVKVVRLERRGPELRLTFLCGGRALAHYDGLNRLTDDLARRLTVAVEELPETLERLQNEARLERKERERLQEALLDYEVTALVTGAQPVGAAHVVVHTFSGRNPQEVRRLASRIASQAGHLALLGVLPGAVAEGAKLGKAHLLFARAADLPHDMRTLLQQTCRLVGGGGGGSADLVQGGGCDPARLDEALQYALAQVSNVKCQMTNGKQAGIAL
jgi:alanyl-tRNA synthetase